MVAGFASALGKQARGTVLLEAAQQTKHLTPLQADQHTGVTDTQATRLNPQQHVKTAELLLAHRQHRRGAPPGTPEPGDVSPLLCRGVSSLYCVYIHCLSRIEKSQFLTDRDVTISAGGRARQLDGQQCIDLMVEQAAAGEAPSAGGGGPQGQALRRLVRRGESEPTDNAVELVRYRLAKVGTDPVQPTLNMWPTCP